MTISIDSLMKAFPLRQSISRMGNKELEPEFADDPTIVQDIVEADRFLLNSQRLSARAKTQARKSKRNENLKSWSPEGLPALIGQPFISTSRSFYESQHSLPIRR